MKTPFDTAIDRLQKWAEPVLEMQGELRDEIIQLFRIVVVDRSMAIARARRLLEILIVDHYIRWKSLAPPYRNKLKPLYNLIEELGTHGGLPQSIVSLCHAVRLEGNRILHYAPEYPGEPRWAEVTEEGLIGTLLKLLEVAERTGTGSCSIYLASLSPPFALLYERLHREWRPLLEGKQEDQFPLFEALDLLFRSIVAVLMPRALLLLEKYANDHTLAEWVSPPEEHALRQLRNLGLIQHEGPWLFTPTRSRRIWPTAAGRVFLALSEQGVSADSEPVAREVVQHLKAAVHDPAAIEFLEKVARGKSVMSEDRPLARRLRNCYLVTHETHFLEGAETLKLTDLGYHVLGKCSPV